jgi:hypothetical protein
MYRASDEKIAKDLGYNVMIRRTIQQSVHQNFSS